MKIPSTFPKALWSDLNVRLVDSRVATEQEWRVKNNCPSYGNRTNLSSTTKSGTQIWLGDSQGPSRLLSVKEHHKVQMAPWSRKKLDCKKKNDMALSSLKMGASFRADIPQQLILTWGQQPSPGLRKATTLTLAGSDGKGSTTIHSVKGRPVNADY